jgi:hypothetical protein
MKDEEARNVLITIVAVLYREGKISKKLMKELIKLVIKIKKPEILIKMGITR